MRICSLLILMHCLMVILAGCREHRICEASSTATSTASAASDPKSPHHSNMELFVNTRTSPDIAFDNKDGCTTSFSPEINKNGTKISYGSKCGYPGAVSKITWDYTHSDDDGDHYQFGRLFPHGEPDQTSSEVNVVFTGTEVVLFEDDWHRIVLKSKIDEQ